MNNELDWTFQPRGSEEPAVGDYLPGKILQSRKLDPIDILAREGGQNTLNQPLDELFNKPINVEIKLIELTGNTLKDYLHTLKWSQLKSHIEACGSSSSQSMLSRNLKKSLKEIDDTNSLLILNIEDSSSFGLTGPEGNLEKCDRPNFFNLTKAAFFTAEKAKATRGGSYGVGKSIFWNGSKISTVLFSSLVDKTENNQSGLRIYGRCELSSHNIKKSSYMGPGFFGLYTKKTEGSYSYPISQSVWNNEEISKKLFIERDKKKGTGATVSILGFKEDLYESGHEAQEILIGIKKQFEKYFWPAIALSPKKLNLSFVYQRNLKIRNDFDDKLEINLSKWQNFIDAAKVKKDKIVKIANTANSLSMRELDIKIPPRKDPIPEIKEKIKNDTKTPFELSIKRGDKNSFNHEEANRIALIRGFGMVVEYKQSTKQPISSSLPYFSVVKVGELLGSSNKNIISEVFFKDLEPALHDRWDAKTQGLDTRYNKKVNKVVEEFYEIIDENLLEMLGEEETESKKGPELLAEMLNLGFKGKKESDYIISSENIKAVPDGKYKWNVSGIIKISDFPKNQDKKEKKSWNVGFGFSIKEETSRGDKISFSEIKFNEPYVKLINDNKEAKVEVTDNKSFSFEGLIDLEKHIGKQNPKLFAINFFTTN